MLWWDCAYAQSHLSLHFSLMWCDKYKILCAGPNIYGKSGMFWQSEIHQLERTRESMAKELVNLSNKNDELEEQVQELPVLQERFKVCN